MTRPPQFHIEVQNEDAQAINTDRLKTAARTVLIQQQVTDGALTIVITDDAAVRQLNHAHRGIDAPTDVLSFPADPMPPELRDPDEPPYLGDTIIAYPYAKAQADRHDHPIEDSLVLLVIHSTLHLLGFDHDTAEKKKRMWTSQAAALTELKIDTSIVPALEMGESGDTPDA